MKPMLLNQKIIFEAELREITDRFVRGFDSDESYSGKIAGLVAKGILPVGVNEDDPRVKEIVERCRERITIAG